MSDDQLFDLGPQVKALQSGLSAQANAAGRVTIDPETVEQDLAKLVLGLMAFLRELMELQAIRRCENGSLTEDEEERLGTTLMRAEQAVHEMAEKFGLSPDELSLDLGPLGRTI
ncbi:MAG: gas vesicle protein K [Pseudomonadota bacterium]